MSPTGRKPTKPEQQLRLPPRTELGKRLRELYQKPIEPLITDIDWSKLEARAAASMFIRRKP